MKYNSSVLILGSPAIGKHLKEYYNYIISDSKQIACVDLVVFTGGEDVHPSLYKEEPINQSTGYNIERDKKESYLFEIAYKLNIPMLGICRGSQFLNVMNGGKLHQHIDKHAGQEHTIVDTLIGQAVGRVTSTHHQCSILGEGAELLATASLLNDDNIQEVEAYYYKKTKCLGIQFHPEFKESGTDEVIYFKQLIEEYIV